MSRDVEVNRMSVLVTLAILVTTDLYLIMHWFQHDSAYDPYSQGNPQFSTSHSPYVTLPDVYLWKLLNGNIFHVPILRNLCYPTENIVCMLHKISHDTTQRMSTNIEQRFDIWLHHHGSHLKHILQVSLYNGNIIYVRNKLCSIIFISNCFVLGYDLYRLLINKQRNND
jgi:hypothetical protein